MTLQLLQRIGEQVGGWLYLVAGFFAFAEAAIMVGVVFPGEAALLIAGFGAHQGWISLGPMLVVAAVAAIAGDSVGYEVGRRYGPALRVSRLGRRIGSRNWARADAFLSRHGGKAVFLGRCTALLRALMPGLAGMARVPYLRTFLPWNIAGGVLWASGCVVLGYLFSASLETVSRDLTWGPIVIIGVLIVGYVGFRLLRRRRERRSGQVGELL
ncbi:MAG TPA: DedA family protein [Pseudonocardia sp.]|nr:DedA family protein [Pseudonocardia sp.]